MLSGRIRHPGLPHEKKQRQFREGSSTLGRDEALAAGGEVKWRQESSGTSSCGERRPAQTGCPEFNDLRGETTSPALGPEVRQPAGRQGMPSLGVGATSTCGRNPGASATTTSGRSRETELPRPAGRSTTSTSGSQRVTRRSYLRETRR